MFEIIKNSIAEAPKKRVEQKTVLSDDLEQNLKNHTINTYLAGLPGQERLVAQAKMGEQVAVEPFHPNTMLQAAKQSISQFEAKALSVNSIEEKLEVAQSTLESSENELQKIEKLGSWLQNLCDHVLFADYRSINNQQVPAADKHFLTTVNKSEAIKSKVKEFGYRVSVIEHSDGETGFVVSGHLSKFVFIYANEEPVDQSEREDELKLSSQELKEQEINQIINQILELLKKEDLEIEEEVFIGRIVEQFHQLEKKFAAMGQLGRFFEVLKKFDPEQNYSLTESLNEIAMDRLVVALAQFEAEREDKKDFQGFWGTGIKDVWR